MKSASGDSEYVFMSEKSLVKYVYIGQILEIHIYTYFWHLDDLGHFISCF